MSKIKYITALAFSLFSISGFAELKTESTTLKDQESTIVYATFEEAVDGDLYVAAEIDGNFWFLKSDGTWVFYKKQEEPFVLINQSEAFSTDSPFSGELELVTVSAQQVKPGTYTLYQVITIPGGDPFDSGTWLKDSINSLVFNINLPEPEPDTIPTPDPQTEPELQDIPEPGSSIFGNAANTDNLDQYFTPKLSQRALGDYTDVVNSKSIWDQLSPEEQKRTLYWDQDQLLGLVENNLTQFDNLGVNSFKPPSKIKLTISEPLSSINITAYPGCVGLIDLNANPRLCGEFNNTVFTGSEVFSQRWRRLKNLDIVNDPLYASIEDKSLIKYDLSVQVGAENVMTPDDLSKIALAFEMSVSKVPGDFSENACKPNKATQYSSSLTVRLTQWNLKTFDPNLPEVCKVNSEELKYYYVNVRAVNIDKIKNEINESVCNPATGCKFEILSYLDSPL